jgi:hypothetical protein
VSDNLHHDDWDEFDWERSLRDSDRYAARYFELLTRFCDLPGADELIADRMGPDFEENLPDCSYDCDTCEDRWDCEFAQPQEWLTQKPGGTGADEEEEDDGDDDRPIERGDDLFYETHPAFHVLRQTALGWCNIYAAVLPPEARKPGLRILFEIGRALANLSYSIGNGLYEQPSASIAFAKRSLAHLNAALGEIARLTQDRQRLAKLLRAIRGHLLKARQAVVDHLQECREATRAD